MDVGDLITLYRKQAGMTIDELAAASGVPKGTLNKITGGVTKAPTLDNMKSIARALGKTLADFDDLPIPQTKTPGPDGPRDEKEQEFIQYVSQMTEEQKRFLVAVMKVMIEQEQESRPDGMD